MKYFSILLLGLLLGANALGQEVITMTTALPVGTQIFIGVSTDNSAPNKEIKYDLGDGIILTRYLTANGGYGIAEATRGSQPIKIYVHGITSLDCDNIKLTSLDVTQCTSLKYLYCYENQLSELNVSNNPNLIKLDCYLNKIQALDLSNKAELTELSCGGNQLTSLNVTQNTKLTWLELVGNNISSLDISKNNALTRLECSGNKFTYATLPIPQPQWQYYIYSSQKPIVLPKSITTRVEVDLSSQYQINRITTDYTWKLYPSGALLKEGSDYTISGGKTIFLKAPSDSVYCEITNNTFPLSKGKGVLRTTNILITPASKKAQTINFSPLPVKTTGDPPFTLSATTSSNLQITYTSSDPSIASITGNTVTIHKAGTITITATQSGDSNWEAASATQTLTITAAAATKKAQTITFDPIAAKKVGDPSFDLKATASSSLAVTFVSDNSAIASVSGTRVTILKAGTVTITASQGGNGDWNAAEPVTQTLTIGKKAQTINFEAISAKKIKDAPFTLKASSSSNLPITFTSSDPLVASVNGSTVTILKAGTVTITATQAGNEEWEPISTSQKLTISATTGINDEEEENLSIYPNPVTENLYIKGKGLENTNASIFNAMGTNVWSGNIAGQSINVSQLPAGIYLLRLGNKYEVKTIRFEKQ